MSSENDHRQPARPQQMTPRPTEAEHLPCPRCDSTNTKFCYYNNYNLSQPRHFCKSCRRYWTQGGTFRNVPVGGGSRKSSSSSTKRTRTTTTAIPTATTTESSSSTSTLTDDLMPANPVSVMPGMVSGSGFSFGDVGVNLNESVAGSFTSLLNVDQGGVGFFGGFGLGLESGLNGMGFGVGMCDWPVEQGGGAAVSGVSDGCDTWQANGDVQVLQDGVDNGDFFGWPGQVKFASCSSFQRK